MRLVIVTIAAVVLIGAAVRVVDLGRGSVASSASASTPDSTLAIETAPEATTAARPKTRKLPPVPPAPPAQPPSHEVEDSYLVRYSVDDSTPWEDVPAVSESLLVQQGNRHDWAVVNTLSAGVTEDDLTNATRRRCIGDMPFPEGEDLFWYEGTMMVETTDDGVDVYGFKDVESNVDLSDEQLDCLDRAYRDMPHMGAVMMPELIGGRRFKMKGGMGMYKPPPAGSGAAQELLDQRQIDKEQKLAEIKQDREPASYPQPLD